MVLTVQDRIYKLLWDKRIILIPDDIARPLDLAYVVIKDLTLEDRNHYMIQRELEIHKSKQQGVPSEEEITANAKLAGYWTDKDEFVEKTIDDHIAFLESEFTAKKKFKSRQNIIQTQIAEAQKQKLAVQHKRFEFRGASAEYLAHEIASLCLLQRVIFYPDGRKILPDDSAIIYFKEHYFSLLYFLIQEMVSEGMMEIKDIREIARSPEWRITWTICRENLSSIFNRSIGDLTVNHRLLIYWSRVYDSAIEGHEPPSFETIQDDDLFDQWLANRDLNKKTTDETMNDHVEQGRVLDGEYINDCTCGAKEKNKGKYLGERILHDNSCLYGTWHKYSREEKEQKANAVYSRNNQGMRKLINKEQDIIEQNGAIEEQHLRNRKTREFYGMKTNVIPIRRR